MAVQLARQPKSLPTARRRRLPSWIKTRLPAGDTYRQLKQTVKLKGLATVCEEARCPNIAECWNGGTATVMLLGDTCTRGCRFCAVQTAKVPPPPNPKEPDELAHMISGLGLTYVVLTMVDRDDLPDGGARHVAAAVEALRQRVPELLVEVLVSDFRGNRDAIETVVAAAPAVFAHNLETVASLTPTVRDPRCGYQQSLDVLAEAKRIRPQVFTKTSLMLGLGETQAELATALRDLRAVGVDMVTFGQYLQPSSKHLPVIEFLTPERFTELGDWARDAFGFTYVASGPMVRSSYRAGELFVEKTLRQRQRGVS